MRILVTNDDGVSAPGLAVAEAVAQEIAQESAEDGAGEVWTVAPAFEQSGVSHAISFNTPVLAEQLGPRRFAVQGTPADCVILAMHAFLADAPPDLVISGVNRGHNFAEDAVYSGTVGGAIEAAIQGVKAVALSQYFRRAPDGSMLPPEILFDAARAHGVAAVRRALDSPWRKDLFYNVNFPPVEAAKVKGLRAAPQGRRMRGSFACEKRTSPGGRGYFWILHKVDNTSAGPQDDVTLCADGWATLTPMTHAYTEPQTLEALLHAEASA